MIKGNIKKVKKFLVCGIIIIFSISGFIPTINSQFETRNHQIIQERQMIKNEYQERSNWNTPDLNGCLENVYLTHGTRVFYGNATYQNASENLYFIDNTTIDPDFIWIAIVLNPAFVDNTYGNGTVPQYRNPNGNPCGHNFVDLNASDVQGIKLYDSNNNLVFYAFLDLIYYGTNAPSGYGIPIWGSGESQVFVGDSSLVQYNTSTCFNVNYYYNTPPYNVLSDSPTLGDQNYNLYPGYEEWEYRIIYELKVNRSLFEGNSLNISATEVLSIHASPNKIGPHMFGLYPMYGSLGDYVWVDVDKDGIQDTGETGLSGVIVHLYYYYQESNAMLLSSTTTASMGNYLFDFLAPGAYYLQFILPVGYRFTLPNQTDDACDSDADVVNGKTETIVLSPDEDDPTWDAGIYLKEFSLTISIQGNGTVDRNPNQTWYTYGQIVTLTADPSVGWRFNHWSGDLVGSTNPTTITMDENKSVIANFTQLYYTLTITIEGSGTVTKNPNQSSYIYGQVVTLTAAPSTGWHFDHWAGDLTGNTNPTTITMNSNKSIIANFTQNVYTLTITIDPTEGGTVDQDPEPPYHYGDVVTLTATPTPGYTFDHWSGDASGSSTVTTVTMDGNKSVTAHFNLSEYSLTITVDPAAGGTVFADPGPPYNHNDTVTLTATANTGYVFDHWSGDASGSLPITTIIMDGNKSVTAHFILRQYTLTITIDGEGTVIKDPNQTTYTYGTAVQLTGVPESGWLFDHWSGDLTGSDNPITVVMTSDKNITVHFSLDDVIPTVEIVKPEKALYIFNVKIRSYILDRKPVIIGKIDIEVNASDDETGINRVEFYIDGSLIESITTEPYKMTWSTWAFFRHTIKVVAYDNAENSESDEIIVWKFF